MATKRCGFTLLELLITVALLAVVSMLGFVAVRSSTQSAATAVAKGDVQQALRDVTAIMVTELQTASNRENDALNPPLEPVAITVDPAPNSPVEISFQTPTDGSGRRFTRRIRFRFFNEDANNNAVLDAGEDANQDGALTRCILRMEDTGGSADPDETRIVGGANCISDVQFALNGNVLTITLTASQLIAGRQDTPITATTVANVYFVN